MLQKLIGDLAAGAEGAAAVARSGLLRPERPDKLVRMAAELQRRGPLAAACSAAAIRYGERPALVDERGTLSYREIDERSNAIARAWIADGLRSGDGVALLCRNHRGFAEALFAAAKVGLRIVLLNTEFAAPQIADVCKRERASTVVFDAEFSSRIPGAERLFCSWSNPGEAVRRADGTLDELIAANSTDPVEVPSTAPQLILLTSGTTGTPKGAPRSESGSLLSGTSLLSRIPFRSGEPLFVAPPFFHALGFGHLLLGFGFGSPVVTRARFDAAATIEAVGREGCTALIAVPVMLQRILDLGPEQLAEHETSQLRIVFSGGAQLPGPTASALLEAFGDVLYVLYGSTEVAYVSVSVPADHRAAPTTVGKPVHGVKLKLLDDDGREVGKGETGRIFVSSGMEFDGYTDGRNKEIIDGLMSAGDLGHLDDAGRLFIDGRDDEMIVSGGENVYPQEVEELLIGHPEVADAAVIGVDDEQFGKRLAAYVVVAEGCDPSAELLSSHVRDNLARFKAPREVHFLDELPRNATGKILKRKLAEPADS